MRGLLPATTLVAAGCALAGPASAQSAKSPLDATSWGVVYDVPATRQVTLRADVLFAKVGERTLKLDLYLPPGLKAGEQRAAVVFLNAIGDNPTDPVRRWAIYRSWPRLVAAHGMIGISMDTDGNHPQESLHGLFRFLRREGGRYGVDPGRLGVYAASANVSGAHTYLTGDSVDPGIRAAALYYGGVPDGHLRSDVPVLFVAAQSDVPRMGAALPGLWQRVVDSALPWTLTFGRAMPHGFDAFSDTDEARGLIQQTLAFWRSHLEPLPARANPPEEGRTIVAALFGHEDARAADLLSAWVRKHPSDAVGLAQFGQVLVNLGRQSEADTAWSRAYGIDSTNPGIIDGLSRLRMAQQRWGAAESLLLRQVAMGQDDSRLQGQLGWARLHLGKNPEAVANYERAIALGIPAGRFRAVAYYNLACGYVRVGRKDDALAALGNAVDQGMNDRATFEQEDDLAPLRGDPRFGQLLERLSAVSR